MAERKRCPSLFAGILWTGLGVLFLLRSFTIGPDLWSLIGRYWPILLILLGLGKVIEYYRRAEGVSLRIGEVFAILFLVIIGSAVTRVSESPMRDMIWTMPIRIGSSDVSLGNSYAYTQEETYAVSEETALQIENSYGSITVTPGSDREVKARLRKVVFSDDEAPAKGIAAEIRLEGKPEGTAEAGTFVLKTNRDALSSKDYRYNTDLEISVPKKVRLKIVNSFGAVSISGLEGNLDVSTSQKSIEVRDFKGEVSITNRYGDSRLMDITGGLTVDSRGRVEVEGVQGKVVIRDEYSPVTVRRTQGPVTVNSTEGSVTVEDVTDAVIVEGRGSAVTARNLGASLKVTTSHRRIRINDVGAGVTVDSRYATVNLAGIKGDVLLESNSDRLACEDIQGSLTVKAKGSGVQASRIKGAVLIDSTLKDVDVVDFEGACSVTSEFADVSLSTEVLAKDGITVRNKNGKITLLLLADAAFTVDASTRSGNIDSDFDELKPAAEAAEVAVLRGSVKTGGPKILLQTEHSNIRLGILDRERDKRSVSQ